ncbi:MAG TPA: P-loop NTPase fold protein [Pedobacter sp.]|nr:P-loop NTPase fold protein [Pedobacter sp.]
MKSKQHSNTAITEDYVANDDFDFAIKGDAIVSYLEHNLDSLKDNKMIALYGNWGSGKTSLMRHMAKRLVDGEIYVPIFFEAWQHEKDENLALSLCDAMTHELPSSEGIERFKRIAVSVLRGFGAGLSVKVENKVLGYELGFNGKDTLEAVDKSLEDKTLSHFKTLAEFKESFQKLEKSILKNNKATRLLVFVDDLDRCEPENVLNLITALKLFFTYGENTIFLAALDKEAVTKAVVTKYKDVVKAEEYLEKVFDVTFGMPKTFSLQKYLGKYFSGKVKNSYNNWTQNVEILEHFFNSIHFNNPRHIKKVLNKFEILRSYKSNGELPNDIKKLIPSLLGVSGDEALFQTIFTLYFIILYENYPDLFEELEHYNRKFNQYIHAYKSSASGGMTIDVAARNLERYRFNDIESLSFKKMVHDRDPNEGFEVRFYSLLLVFSHGHPDGLNTFRDDVMADYARYFNDNSKHTLFCKFLIKYKFEIQNAELDHYIFWNYFKMAKYLL